MSTEVSIWVLWNSRNPHNRVLIPNSPISVSTEDEHFAFRLDLRDDESEESENLRSEMGNAQAEICGANLGEAAVIASNLIG